MSDFNLRAMEIHSQYAWDFRWVKKAIHFMKENNMTTLILHRNDFIDLIVYPGKYFGSKEDKYNSIFERYQEIFRTLYKYTPTRRSGPYQRRAYLKRVIEEARRAGIDVFIQNKELYFPEILLEFYPELVKDGKICPNEPFWWEFIKTKYTEFFEEFPEISGIITAPATGESKVSISSNRCTCDKCRSTAPQKWYESLIMAMHEPITKAGKRLVIRDFVFDSKNHQEIANTMESLPNDVVIALKNTPHDYYPTFPDNPRIGHVGNHDQWIEFDSMGQYFGWGIGPAIIIEDIRKRMKSAKNKGASGVIIRTDWESLDGHTAFDTLNILNLYGAAALADNLDVDSVNIYRNWLEDKDFYINEVSEEGKQQTVLWLKDIMENTWEVIRRTVYVNDCVFSDSSQIPISLEHALWLAEEKNSLKDWDKTKADALNSDQENVQRIMEEKDQALQIVQTLYEKVKRGHEGITDEGQRYLTERFDVFHRYVKTFRMVVHAIILSKYILNTPEAGTSFYEQGKAILEERLNGLLTLAKELEDFYKDTSYQHTVYTLLDNERLIALHSDLQKRLKIIQK